jgi:hypothetical protein
MAAALLVGVITFMVFSPALRNDFIIGWDDDVYVTGSPFSIPLSAAAVGMMFSRFYFLSYTPLTHLSHAIDYAMWGLDPRGHHLTNILLHSGNAVLVFFVMLAIIRMRQADRSEGGRLTGKSFPAVLWGCLIAGLFFSLQPLRVESVACASSRKDLLSAFFSFGAVLLYLRYASRRGHTPARGSYLLSLLLFTAAILSKGSVVMIPGVLLLLDLAVEREVRSWRWLLLRLWEKVPFFIIAAAGAYVSYRASISDDMDLVLYAQSHINRLELGSYNLGFYLAKTVWPFRFAAVYDYPGRVASLFVSSVLLHRVVPRKERAAPWLDGVPPPHSPNGGIRDDVNTTHRQQVCVPCHGSFRNHGGWCIDRLPRFQSLSRTEDVGWDRHRVCVCVVRVSCSPRGPRYSRMAR